tara:strand:+ start:1948 stop:2778 length:831 start_codon:yes stop_codon:yes gene_type:complete
MATAKKNQTPTSETSVAVRAAGGEIVTYDYGDNAGAGWGNTTQDDFSIPFLNQLQALSPQVQEGEDTHVEGAKVGMFYNSVTKSLRTEVIFVPIQTEHVFVEWVPQDQGGGFVGVHQLDSAVVAKARAEASDRNLKVGNNELVETFYIYALILDEVGSEETSEMVVMSFSSTKIKRYKSIMSRLRTMKGSKNIPLFAHQIRMHPTPEKSPAGQSYKNVEMNPAVNGDVAASLLPTTSPLLEVAAGFLESISSGERTADHSTSSSAGAADTKTDEVF